MMLSTADREFLKDKSEEFKKGYQAWFDGKGPNDNPNRYRNSTELQRNDWESGRLAGCHSG